MQMIEPVDPSKPDGEVRCKACDHRWSSSADVIDRERTICPDVFFTPHVGGWQHLAPLDPPEHAPAVLDDLGPLDHLLEEEMVVLEQEVDETAYDSERSRTRVECPGCHMVTAPADGRDTTSDDVYCYDCGSRGRGIDQTKRTLICTVGLPRSGKSTWAKASGYPVVNPDSIRLALHGRDWYHPAEPWVWAMAKTMVEALFLAGHNTVVLDSTQVAKDRRDHWTGIYGEDIVWKVFRTPADVCKARATALGQEDLLPVVDRMAALWDVDDPIKGIKK